MPKPTKTKPKDYTIKFQNITKATPAFVGRIKNAVNLGIIGFIPYMGDVATEFNISETRLEVVIALLGIGLNMFAAFFGVPLTGETVPARDVTEIETGG